MFYHVHALQCHLNTVPVTLCFENVGRNIFKHWITVTKLLIIEGFHAKRVYRYIAFWVDFHFLQDQTNFWQTDLLGHRKHHSVIVSLDLHFLFKE